jgi:uncharacterized protein (TIGR02453 family)
MSFAGFPEEAIEFYEGLEADNSKPYWTAHRETYDRCVRGPMEALLAAVEPEFGEGHVFRPYRDVRYARDKSPYKTHQGAYVGRPDGAVLYVELSADGLLAAGGIHHMARDQLQRLRAAILDDATAASLASLLDDLSAVGFEIGGSTLKRAPRGIPLDHPRIGLLRHTALTASRHWPPSAWLTKPEAVEPVRETWRELTPLNEWLGRHVGPSDLPPDRRP